MYRLISLILPAFIATCTATSPHIGMEYSDMREARKREMLRTLLGKAQQTENSQFSRGLDAAAEVDLTGYEIKFNQCQNIKTYDDQLAEDQGSSNVLSTKRFIVFRLCPSGSCNSCSANYGEYVIDLETYIQLTTQYYAEEREQSCQACENLCYVDDDGMKNKASSYVDCDNCQENCQFVENMNNNGYVDSYQYAECVKVYEDNNGNEIYAGAMCHNKGLKIAAFSDQYCSVYESDADIEDFLNGVKLYDDILEKMSSSSNCVSCVKKDYEMGDDKNNGYVEENDLCTEIYESAAKCESKHGFNNYWKNYENYANQYVQEDRVCDFIDTLGNGNYDQNGEIVLSGTMYDEKTATGLQKFGMTFFVLGTVASAIFAAFVRSKLKEEKTDLSAQEGGTLA